MLFTPVARGDSRVSYEPPPPLWKLIKTIKVTDFFKPKVLIGVKFDENLQKLVMENRAFRKFKWSVWKLLDCRILHLHQIPKGFWEPWAAPKPQTCRIERTPLWKFLPTGLLFSMMNIHCPKPLDMRYFINR